MIFFSLACYNLMINFLISTSIRHQCSLFIFVDFKMFCDSVALASTIPFSSQFTSSYKYPLGSTAIRFFFSPSDYYVLYSITAFCYCLMTFEVLRFFMGVFILYVCQSSIPPGNVCLLLPSSTVLLEIIARLCTSTNNEKYRSFGIHRVWIVCCFLFMTIHLQLLSMIPFGLLLFDPYTRKLFENGS